MELMNAGDCRDQCCDLSTEDAARSCQDCLAENMKKESFQCELMSGASCWYCSASLSEKLRKCSESKDNSGDIINCIKQGCLYFFSDQN